MQTSCMRAQSMWPSAILCFLCTYELQEHVAQQVVRMRFGLQAGLHSREHFSMQLQDVLNVGKQDLCVEKYKKR